MSPPSLTFTREMRTSIDVVIRFTPRTTGMEVVHHRGHIYLLSDLFLVCERMLPEDRDKYGASGADMWLCYPPLAGKVLRVSEVEGQSESSSYTHPKPFHLLFFIFKTEHSRLPS